MENMAVELILEGILVQVGKVRRASFLGKRNSP